MSTAEKMQLETGEQEDLDELSRLVNDSRIPEARARVTELVAKWPESERVYKWSRVLEPPRILNDAPKTPVRSHAKEQAWIKAHAHEYPGCWMAIYEDRLIAAGTDRQAVTQAARADLGDEIPVLFYYPAKSTEE